LGQSLNTVNVVIDSRQPKGLVTGNVLIPSCTSIVSDIQSKQESKIFEMSCEGNSHTLVFLREKSNEFYLINSTICKDFTFSFIDTIAGKSRAGIQHHNIVKSILVDIRVDLNID